MDIVIAKLHYFAPVILRVGLAIVFLSFGVDKIIHPDFGASEIQLILGISYGTAEVLNYASALFELTLVVLLFTGWQLRFTAPVAALWLLTIIVSLGVTYGITNPAVSRDIGLFSAALALWGLENRGKRIEERE